MSTAESEIRSPIKPHYFPEDFDFSGLPVRVQLAITTLVTPLHEELVLGAPTETERSMANSFAMLAAIELDSQFELGAKLNFSGTATPEERAERDRLIDRMLRLVGAKQRTAQFMQRLKTLREKSELAGS